MYLQDDVILSSDKAFDKFVEKYNKLSDLDIDKEMEEEEV